MTFERVKVMKVQFKRRSNEERRGLGVGVRYF
jgi:hypothetical protein